MATLREVIEYYRDGGNPNPNLDPVIQPIELSERDMGDLVAFLEALTGEPATNGGPEIGSAVGENQDSD